MGTYTDRLGARPNGLPSKEELERCRRRLEIIEKVVQAARRRVYVLTKDDEGPNDDGELMVADEEMIAAVGELNERFPRP